MKKGILITILVIVLFIIFLALMGGYVYMQFTREPYIPDNAYLKIDLSGTIVDNQTSAFSKSANIRDLWYQIKRAKIDKRIKGIFIKISQLRSGYAKTEDLGRLLQDFRQSGKKVVAFIESAGTNGYYLSTFADKVYLLKRGDLFLSGLATEAMFLKNTFSQLGIEAQVFHIGKYKTAANMFTEDKMTEAHKESISKLLEDIYAVVLAGIARNRGQDPKKIAELVDSSPTENSVYLDNKLVDGLLYEDEVMETFEPGSDYQFVTLDTYKQTKSPLPYNGVAKIAVIFASGEIHSGPSGGRSMFGGEVMGSDTVAAQLRAARENRFIKAVVLRVDSPGGSALASDVIRREAELLSKKKPLIISMADVAASGGYWLSMSGGTIMALPQTITGSIGVVAGKFVLKGLYDKVGITKEMLKTSRYAGMFSDYRKFDDEETQKIMGVMERIYDSFLEVTSEGRGIDKVDVDKIAQGRVWAGSTAKELKLIDQLGGLDEAIKEAQTLAKTDDPLGISIYPKKQTVFEAVMDFFGAKATVIDPVSTVEAQLAMYENFFPALLMPYRLTVR